jgi:glycosyltransferase 2 family protein
MTTSNKKLILIVLKIIVTIALFVLIVLNVSIQKISTILDNFEILFFFFGLAILILQTMVATFRWRIVLSGLNVEFNFGKVLSFLWIGLFFNQTLVSNVGGDALRGYCVYKNGYGLGLSSISVLLDRVFGIVGLIILMIFSFPIMLNLINDKEILWGIVFLIMSVLSLIASSFMLDLLPKKMDKFRIIKGFFTFSREGRKQILSIYPGSILILLSIVVHLISIVVFVLLSKGMSLDLDWYNLFFIVPFVTLLSAVPISIAGWGVREGVMVVSLGYLGVAPEQALVLSILYGVLMLISSAPGLLIWLKGDYSTSD